MYSDHDADFMRDKDLLLLFYSIRFLDTLYLMHMKYRIQYLVKS